MGGKHSTSTSTVSIPPEVLARYNAVNKRAENVSMQPYKAFGNTAEDYVAQINDQQNAGIADINKYASAYQPYLTNARGQTQAGINSINANVGAYKPYFEDATNATNAGMAAANLGNLDINKYLSPYLSEVRDTTATLMNQANNQAQSGALGTAISSGAFGGDRAGIAAANLNQQNQLAMGNTMANIGNQGYQFAATTAQGQQAADLAARQANLERQMYGGAQLASLGSQAQQLGLSGGQAQLAGAQQMAGLGSMAQQLGLQGAQAKIAAGTLQQQTEQAGKDAMVQRFMQEQGYPFQVAQFLANIAMGTGAASGSSTSTTTPRNWMGFAQGGGVSGPRTYSQGTIGGDGYVPAGDLPIGQLMVADPPQQDQGNGMEDVIKLIASIKGAAHGGVIDGRHGYATDGGVHPTHWNPVTQKYEMEPIPTTGVVTPAATPAPATGVVAPDAAPAPATGVVAPVTRRPEPTPSGWDTFRPKVSQRESGNDPNALLNFANREGKQFAGTNLTGMTVDQAIDFARVGGPYANYSKTQTPDGRVATPMGEYQIVGTTLAQAKRDMGLTGDELMTAELQERIAHHLYDNYGEKPWAASAPTGGLDTNISTMSAPDQQYSGGVKPYEERNFIGKFFHNRDGSMNQNALLSVLMGVGKAAEAQTISPLGGILSGIGGGAEAYKGLQKQAADIGFTKAQTATEAVQLLRNSIYYDANLGMSVIPLAGGGQQSLADFVVNPAGPSMAGPEADAIIRSIAGGANSRGVDLATATPEQIFSVAPPQTGQGSGIPAGMPVPPVVTPYESFGTFPLGDLEKAYISQAETRARLPMTAPEREALIARSEATRAAADSGTAASSLAFRNTNELAATVAKAAANNDLGPLGGVKATYENLASQVADTFGIQYDGSAASSQALLNKLSTLSADQMTADTAAASLYLQNKNIFPDINSNPTAAAEITAEMLTKNMFSYEKGQYINDIYRAQRGVVKDLTGADAMFNKKAGSIYQGEKTNIADLLKYAGNADADPEVKQLIVEFFDSANRGAFKDQEDAQAALEAIFTVLPGQHNVSNGLGRYFVQ